MFNVDKKYCLWKNTGLEVLKRVDCDKNDMVFLSKNPNITPEYIRNNIDLHWDWYYLSYNPNITIDFYKETINKPWDWGILLMFGNITPKDIENNPDLPWSYTHLSYNPNISIDFVFKNAHLRWSFLGLSGNQNTRMEDIENNLNLSWNWECYISQNPNINVKFARKYSKKLNWKYVSRNPGISEEDVENNPDLPWGWESLSLNPNISMNFVKKYIKKEWDWELLSGNPNITFDFIRENFNDEEYEDHKLSPYYLTVNPGITIDDIESNPRLCWLSSEIFKNPNLRIEDFCRLKFQKYCQYKLFENKFLYNPVVNKREKIADIKWRRRQFKNFSEEISPFSRWIDVLIRKRLKYA